MNARVLLDTQVQEKLDLGWERWANGYEKWCMFKKSETHYSNPYSMALMKIEISFQPTKLLTVTLNNIKFELFYVCLFFITVMLVQVSICRLYRLTAGLHDTSSAPWGIQNWMLTQVFNVITIFSQLVSMMSIEIPEPQRIGSTGDWLLGSVHLSTAQKWFFRNVDIQNCHFAVSFPSFKHRVVAALSLQPSTTFLPLINTVFIFT